MLEDAERLEGRVRDALGGGVAGYRTHDQAQARADVLGGIRRRRRRRLQVATGGFALALSFTLPFALGSGTPTRAKEKPAAGSTPAQNREPPNAPTTGANCEVGGESAPVPCGLVGPAAAYGSQSATSASPSAAPASTAVGSAARPLVLRVGQDAIVALPHNSTRRPWQQPRPVADDALVGGHRILVIRRTGRREVWRLVAERAGSIVLRSQRAGCGGRAAACLTPTSTWSLKVEVTS